MRKIGLVFAGLLLLRVASGPTADLAYILLIFYALYSRGHAIEALFLSFVFTHLNTTIFPDAALASISRYLIVFSAFMSVVGRDLFSGRFRLDSLSQVVIVFTVFTWIHSVFFSLVPVISILKVTILCLAFLTLLHAWRTVDDATRERVEYRIFGTLALIVIVSLVMKGYPGAYMPRSELLRGLTNQSQVLGVISAIVAVWSFMRAVGRSRPSWIDLGLFALAAFTILNTGARTALLSVALTILVVATLALVKFGRVSLKSFSGARSARFVLFALLGVGVLISQADRVRRFLIKAKGAVADSGIELTELYRQSRGGLISEMWANIASDPFFGIGFGIASNPEEMYFKYFAGIPISAPVEKGVTLLAVWEEVGLIGLFIFLVMLLVIFRRSIATGAERAAVFVAILLLNMGEASLLSAGGIGLVQLVLLGWIISGSRDRPAQIGQPESTRAPQAYTRVQNTRTRAARK